MGAKFYTTYTKRILDIIFALLIFTALSPVFAFIALMVKIKLGSPIFFKQKRPGLNERIFTMYKFRTMTNKRDKNGVLLPDKERITRFGKFLRATSLDELPELINIIKGDMSFIGPRPLLIEYLPLYNETQKQRHNVRPGLSGLAQVSGRNSISWEEKFDIDVKYVNNACFSLDCKILFLTIIKVFMREGIDFDTGKTSNRFAGSKVPTEKKGEVHK
ncbi:sugar transferase [Shouchella clausii]|uniref:sugar transferase n=1 Tax=Shouchella clausii TaxID=79880 RepID=UPI0031FE408D